MWRLNLSSKTALLLCAAMALIIRLAWSIHLPAELPNLPDQNEYLQLGRNLLGRGLMFHDTRFNADVYAYRTPGYPLFIAACGGSVRAVRIAQSFLDASSVLAVYLLARRWLTDRSSLFAAAIVAFNPYLIYFSGLLLSETLFTFLLIWGMTLLVRAGPVKLVGYLLLAFAVLVRPSDILLPVFLAAVPLNRLHRQAYQWIGSPLLAGGMVLLVLLPWAWRNHAVLNHWIWTTTNCGVTLYDGFNPAADGSSNQRFIQSMPELAGMGEVERGQFLAGRAWAFIRDHPMDVARLTVRKVLRTWSPIPLSAEYGGDRRYVAVVFYMLPLFVLAGLGILRGPLGPAVKVFLLLPAIYITVIHAASVGSLRYRVPADVPLAVLAASVFRGSRIKNASFVEHSRPPV